MRTIAHLVTGEVIKSKTVALTDEMRALVEEMKTYLGDLAKSAPDEGWMLTLDTATGFVVVPRSSVLYIEVQGV